MTTCQLKLRGSVNVLGKDFTPSLETPVFDIADGSKVYTFDGVTIGVSLVAGVLSLYASLPFFGKIWSKSFNEDGTHDLTETLGDDTVTGEVIIAVAKDL